MSDIEAINQQLEDAQAHADDSTQYLSFTIDKEEFAVDITTVREVKGWTQTTRLPNKPEYLRGVLNLRGTIIPIFDLRARFGRGRTEANVKHVIIVLAIEGRTMGILVDAVADILNIRSEDIKPSPSREYDGHHAFISGLVALPERMVSMLDVHSVVNMPDSQDTAA